MYFSLDTSKRSSTLQQAHACCSRSELHEPASEADPWRNERVIGNAFFLVWWPLCVISSEVSGGLPSHPPSERHQGCTLLKWMDAKVGERLVAGP
jgi:hypothetical protein